MDLGDIRSMMELFEVDIWALLETAIAVASLESEFKTRRGSIVDKLYAPNCSDCNHGSNKGQCETQMNQKKLPSQEHDSSFPEKEESDRSAGTCSPSSDLLASSVVVDDSDRVHEKIIAIGNQLLDSNQTEESLIGHLRFLASMSITINALKETGIGKQVNMLGKHSSTEVSNEAKKLVRKWREVVDQRLIAEKYANSKPADAVSPQKSHNSVNTQHNHHQQVSGVGSSGLRKNNSYAEAIPRRTPPCRPDQPKADSNVSKIGSSGSGKTNSNAEAVHRRTTPCKPGKLKADSNIEQSMLNLNTEEKFDSARKRLRENYQEAEMAKKRRNIKVMDIHDTPKPEKNGFMVKIKCRGL